MIVAALAVFTAVCLIATCALMAYANHVMRQIGNDRRRYRQAVAEQMAELEKKWEREGVDPWLIIEARIQSLR